MDFVIDVYVNKRTQICLIVDWNIEVCHRFPSKMWCRKHYLLTVSRTLLTKFVRHGYFLLLSVLTQ